MNLELILELAEKVYGECDWHESALAHLEQFAELVAEHEREVCAEICDGFYLNWIDIQGRYEFMGEGASECAGAIRARGQ
jgi:hypothetical protein